MAELRLITWNIAHARGPHRRSTRADCERTLDGIAEVLRREEPHVVALQEVDRASTSSGGFDHLDRLAERAELPHRLHGEHLALTVGRTRWLAGTALLSARPWLRSRSAPFGCVWRDDKGWVAGTLGFDGLEVEVFSVHLDFLNPRVRRRQARRLLSQLCGQTAVVAGDLNTPSEGGALGELVSDRLRLAGPPVATFPSGRPRLCLDRVLVPASVQVREVRVLDDRWSDHRAVRVDLTVLPVTARGPDEGVTSVTGAAAMGINSMRRGDWQRGHSNSEPPSCGD